MPAGISFFCCAYCFQSAPSRAVQRETCERWTAADPRCRKRSDAPLGPRTDTGNIANLSSYEAGMTNPIPNIEVLLAVVSGVAT